MSSAPVARGDLAQRLKISGRGKHAAHVADNRLDDDAGNLVLELGEGGCDAVDIVVRQGERELDKLFRHARRAGNAERRDARAGLHQQRITVAVIAAFELHDDLAAGGGASQANR